MARERLRKNDILEAAIKVFSREGFSNGTIGSIAEQAGIGKGTVYEYFESKNHLFYEMLKYVLERYTVSVEEELSSLEGFTNKLSGFINLHKSLIKNNVNLMNFINMQTYGQSLDYETRKTVLLLFVKARNRVIQILSSVIEEGKIEGIVGDIDIEFCTDMFYAMVIRTSMRPIIGHNDEANYEEETDKIMQLFINGVK